MLPFYFSAQAAFASGPPLVVYVYDSFVDPKGLGPVVIRAFQKKCGCEVKLLPSGDGGQILTRLELDLKRVSSPPKTAHVLLGINSLLWERVRSHAESGSSNSKNQSNPKVQFVPEVKSALKEMEVQKGEWTPFEWSIPSAMVDQKQLKGLGLSVASDSKIPLKDLLNARWKRNLLLEDPRTSSVGLSFLLFTKKVLGEKWLDFWKALQSQWLTLAPGWGAAYGLFLKGQAPWVWSYVTSQAYHEVHGDGDRYRTVLFDEGNPLEIEGAVVVKENPHPQARAFVDFLLSAEVQSQVPLKNWMFPVVEGVKLPSQFESLPKLLRTWFLKPTRDEVRTVIEEWSKGISK